MTIDEDLREENQRQLDRKREVLVTHAGIQSFEEGMTELVLRDSESRTIQRLKVNLDELRDIAHAAMHYLANFGGEDAYEYALRDDSGEIHGTWLPGSLTHVLRVADNLPDHTPVRRLPPSPWKDVPR